VEVPTMNGRVVIKIPIETQTGKAFRLRGKGIRNQQAHSVGDLICKVVIETPVNLTSEQTELLKQLQDSLLKGGERHSPRSKSFFDSLKSFFQR